MNGSSHGSSLIALCFRLMLQGLLPDSIYEICEPLPGHFTQGASNYRIVETEGEILRHWLTRNSIMTVLHIYFLAPIYQLGVDRAFMTGQILMNAGLPSEDGSILSIFIPSSLITLLSHYS